MIKPHISFPKNRKFYALVAGNLVALAAIGVLVLRPILGMLVSHTTEITTVRGQTAAIERKSNELRKLKDIYPQFEQTYAPAIQAVPKTRDIAGYQTELEELARLTSITLLTVDTSGGGAGGSAPKASSQTVQVGGFPAVTVQVIMTGTFATTLDFINRLETMNRFTRVTAMDLTASDTSGAVKATLELQTLYLEGKT